MTELINDADLEVIYPIIAELRPTLSKSDFIKKVRFQNEKMAYKLFGFYEAKPLKADMANDTTNKTADSPKDSPKDSLKDSLKILTQDSATNLKAESSVESRREFIGAMGVMPFFVLYHERCLYICDFAITEKSRNLGLGATCMNLVESWARDNGYNELELSSGFARENAHLFYTNKAGFDKTGFVFKKSLG